MTLFHTQGELGKVIDTPWDDIESDNDEKQLNNEKLNQELLTLFSINQKSELNISYKPFVLLFDEYYTGLYRITEAQERMQRADKIIFMGTSFSVNITQMALETAMAFQTPIEIVDPDPIEVPYKNTRYHKMTALEYIHLYR